MSRYVGEVMAATMSREVMAGTTLTGQLSRTKKQTAVLDTAFLKGLIGESRIVTLLLH